LRQARLFLTFGGLKKIVRPEISRKAIYRLSVYLRCLQRLKANGIRTVSSEALARVAGVKPTQLRKDLACFGQFGTRGLGYDVQQLAGMTSDLLGTNSLQPVILVGVGNLGRALLSYRGFEQEGFEIVAAFDTDPDPQPVRSRHISVPVYGMEKLGEIMSRRRV
jgi:redox-sensing transcriptional repressor